MAAGVGHAAQQLVQGDGVRRGVLGGHGLVVDVVADGGNQSHLVAEVAEQAVEQGGRRGLAVGAGDAHQFQARRRVAIEQGGDASRGVFAVLHHHIRDAFLRLGGQFLADDGAGAVPDGGGDVGMAVGLRAAHGHEEVACLHPARIDVHARYLDVRVADDLHRLHCLQQFIQFHVSSIYIKYVYLYFSVSATVRPFTMRLPGGSDCRRTRPMPLRCTFRPAFSSR